VADGAEIGSIVFGAAYHGADPYANQHLIIRATGATAGDVFVPNGQLKVGPFGTDGSTIDALGVFGDASSALAKVKIFSAIGNVDDLAGLGFGVHTGSAKYIKSAIAHQRKGSYGQGDIVFCVDANTDAADVLIGDEVMRLTSAALVMAAGKNIAFSTATGTQIGTVGGAAGQKLGFWGVPAVVQPVLATGASKTVDEVITVLQAIGLCRQS
jgi:hypothetical protein